MSRAWALTTALLFAAATATTNAAADAIGTVTAQSGPTEIQRDKIVIPSAVSSTVEMNDAVVTARSKVGITFKDDSKVEITEQSKLVIDSFVYDNTKQDAGKLGLKIALGTARFASGQIAKHSPESIKIETPTATVGVRGTDFTLTVDEIGRSLIILLPSCPTNFKNVEKDCIVGEIFVQSDMGTVWMNKAFQATTVTAKEQNPSRPVILALTSDQINNMLILTTPKEKNDGEVVRKTALDINFLDKDMLKFDELNVNYLTSAGNKLDINAVDQNFLFNMLDFLNSQLLENMLVEDNAMLPKYKANKAAGLFYVIEDQSLVLYRTAPSHFAQITVDKEAASMVNIDQDGVKISQTVNRTGGSTITVKQSR